jgi:biopolymer transport protein ExbD
VKVPEVREVRDTAEELPVVTVTRDGKLFLNERPVTNINLIANEVQRRFPGAKEVYVRGDAAVVWEVLAQVLDTLGRGGLGLKMVVKPEEFTGKR